MINYARLLPWSPGWKINIWKWAEYGTSVKIWEELLSHARTQPGNPHHSQSAWILKGCASGEEGFIEYGAMGLSAVPRWKLVPGISRPCPWFTPHSANLPGFNQSASWPTKCFSLPFSRPGLPSVFCLFISPSCELFRSLPQNTFVLSLYLFRFPCLHLSICMLMPWRCLENVAEPGSHSHTPSPAFLLAS